MYTKPISNCRAHGQIYSEKNGQVFLTNAKKRATFEKDSEKMVTFLIAVLQKSTKTGSLSTENVHFGQLFYRVRKKRSEKNILSEKTVRKKYSFRKNGQVLCRLSTEKGPFWTTFENLSGKTDRKKYSFQKIGQLFKTFPKKRSNFHKITQNPIDKVVN